jgi:hypothetical protein
MVNIKKWIKKETLWIIGEANLLLLLSVTIVIAIVLAIIIVETGNFIHKSKCLKSDNFRRWHNVICEEYQDNEWIEVDPFRKNVIYYNKATEAKE